MDLTSGIKTRRSVRKYTAEKIPRRVLEEIVEAARFAPSWENTQIVRYTIIEDRDIIEKLSDIKCMNGFAFNSKTMARASAVAVLTFVEGRAGFEKDGSYTTSKGDRWQMFDAGAAAQTFCLAAHDKGIGTVIIGYYDEEEVSKVLTIPEGQQLAAMIPMGFPEKIPACPKRKEVSELLTII